MPDAEPRALRADAQRNRDLVLASAVRLFARGGPPVTLTQVAEDAGVGIGTLYRHFPTREALVEAAYRDELAKVCAAVPGLLTDMEPHAALRAWMDRFVDYMSTKIGMAEALKEVIASGRTPYQQSREVLNAAIKLLLEAGIEAGSVRSDVPTDDILIFLSGVAMASEGTGDAEQAGRLLDLFMDGLMASRVTRAPGEPPVRTPPGSGRLE